MKYKTPCAVLNKPCPINCKNKACTSPTALFKWSLQQLDLLCEKEQQSKEKKNEESQKGDLKQ